MMKDTISKNLGSAVLALGLAVTSANAQTNTAPESFPMGGYTTAGENTSLNFGFDREDGTNIVVNIINSPINGVIENISGNKGIYRANTNYSGFDGFSYYVSDSQGKKSTNNATFYVKEGDAILTPTLESISSSNGVTTLNAMIQPAPKVTDVERRTTLNGIDSWVKVGEMTPKGYSSNGLVPATFVNIEELDKFSGFYRIGTHKP